MRNEEESLRCEGSSAFSRPQMGWRHCTAFGRGSSRLDDEGVIEPGFEGRVRRD